jgi:hypothetical protein
MSARPTSDGRAAPAASFLRDESGATLVEFGIASSLFLLIFFALIDFGRLGYSWVMAEKAMQRAARIAAVRPPVCAGVPGSHERDPSGTIVYGFGEACGPGICLAVSQTCLGDSPAAGSAGETTAAEVWGEIAFLLPPGTTVGDIRFTYSTDSNLGFLGGPFVPVVTTELDGALFQFVSPLGALARLAGAGNAAGLGTACPGNAAASCLSLPPMSVSLPGEDLAQGEAG